MLTSIGSHCVVCGVVESGEEHTRPPAKFGAPNRESEIEKKKRGK